MSFSSFTSTTTTTLTDQSSIYNYNRGSITSIFKPPAYCLSTYTYFASPTMYVGHHDGDYFDKSCYPEVNNPAMGPIEKNANWNLYYYSPAVSCPLGYTTASTYRSTFGGFGGAFLSLGSSTTAALCCPTGFDAGALGHECTSTIPTSTTKAYPFFSASREPINSNWKSPKLYTTTQPGYSSYIFFGDGIPIWYQQRDQVAFSVALSTSTSSTTPTASTTAPSAIPTLPIPTPISTSANTSPTSPSSRGLSTGAKAGVGIGISVFAIAIGFAAVFFFLRLRKRRANDASWNKGGLGHAHEVDGNGSQVHEVGNNGFLEDQPVFVDRGRG